MSVASTSPLVDALIERPSVNTTRSTRRDLMDPSFYKKDNWFDEFCEVLFKIKERGTTVKAELYYGLIHFISCSYVLAVIPQQLEKAGYNARPTVVSVAATSGIGCMIGGFFTNLPFVLAPPTVISIFVSVYLQSHDLSSREGNAAIVISGLCLTVLFYRPLGQFVGRLIPLPIQVGTTLGVGLLTALAGATEISVVENGDYTILQAGDLTSTSSIICFLGVLIIGTALFYKIKGAFCIALIVCSMLYWAIENQWPSSVFCNPRSDLIATDGFGHHSRVAELTLDLIFLYVLYLSGLISALTELAHLKREDGTTPRARWFYIMAGAMTVAAGCLSSAPILISPESSAAIKAGAKTGLSTVVCGLLFCLAIFLAPIFQAVPSAGTSPLLIMIGVILFQDVSRINWKDISDAVPAFVVMFFIPFTYSIIYGVVLGYLMYVLMGVSTGVLYNRFLHFMLHYVPMVAKYLPEASETKDSIHIANRISYVGSPNQTPNPSVHSIDKHDDTKSSVMTQESNRTLNRTSIEKAGLGILEVDPSSHNPTFQPGHSEWGAGVC